jgi:hypothetical protein
MRGAVDGGVVNGDKTGKAAALIVEEYFDGQGVDKR